GSSVRDILRRHLHDPPAPIESFRTDLPPGLNDVLRKAMAKDPAERHASAGDFVKALAEAREVVATDPPHRGWPRVLIVDDEAETRTIFRTAIKVSFPEATIFSASDGFQGWEMARAGTPDLILADLNMPGMNGLELIAALKGDELSATIPLLVISAALDTKNRAVLESLGIQHFLSKPVELTKLVGVVRQILTRTQSSPGSAAFHS
ncbi:MAG: response regulator, partial [Deltaproteobacteria bacterium]|nr:response regulator [Deltaproteobacteria bacterium]